MKNLLTVLIITLFFSISCGEDTEDQAQTAAFTLTSTAIADGKLLSTYKCEQKVNDKESSIPLAWLNVPAGTGSLAVVMYHYPNQQDGNPNTYLFLWNIDPSVTAITHGAADAGAWYMGPNKDKTAISYTSPCSHSTGTHTYTIKLFALSKTPTSLPTASTLDMDYQTFIDAMATVTVLGTAELSFFDVTE
jgi:phosphatidylethanolamine-binding protein (PEBP) family uncharacterized protein